MIVTVRRGGAGRAGLVEAEARRARADGDGEPPPAFVDLDHLNEED